MTYEDMYEIEKLEDGMVSFVEKSKENPEFIEAIPVKKYSFGIVPVAFGGVGHFNDQDLTKLASNNREDAKEEAKSRNAYGARATIHLFEDGEEICVLYRPYIKNHKRVISRKWENIWDI